jgi:two-component system cell cycle response regulator
MDSLSPPIPHPLETENRALRGKLETLLREARSNEEKMLRFEQLEHRLIAARSLQEVLRLLLGEYKLAFGIEFVTLALVDREQELAHLLGAALREDRTLQDLTLLPAAAPLQARYGGTPLPWLGAYDAQRHAGLFPAAPASVVLLPLYRHGELIGGLHFGSLDAQRYTPDAGTQLLQRLSGIVGVCLESALNQERVKLAGLTDMLTGVHNRRYFEHRCQIEIAQARRHRHPLACMFLDIDEFKRINDRHGHPAGDAVLRAVGQSILGQLRAGDTIARYGGEEFVVLLPQAPAQPAREIAERIRQSVAARPIATDESSGLAVPVTISIGLAMLGGELVGREPARLAEGLVAAADKALYRAKHEGRNRVVWEA